MRGRREGNEGVRGEEGEGRGRSENDSGRGGCKGRDSVRGEQERI